MEYSLFMVMVTTYLYGNGSSEDLEIHFGQLNLFKLFLFKNKKDLC